MSDDALFWWRYAITILSAVLIGFNVALLVMR
jgi:hypothetical protein